MCSKTYLLIQVEFLRMKMMHIKMSIMEKRKLEKKHEQNKKKKKKKMMMMMMMMKRMRRMCL